MNPPLLRVGVMVFAVVLAASANAHGDSVAAGYEHTVVVTPGGTVWTWGDNSQGQLGDGTTVDRPVPVPVPVLSDVTAVAAGKYHTLALRADGSVWAWGANDSGQLGDGSQTRRLDPVPVIGLADVIAIAAGETHSVALGSDGRVWTWGYNYYGQLGDGGTTLSKQPMVVAAISGVSAIAAGGNHTLAIKGLDGSVWGWGANSNGQLGIGSQVSPQKLPVQMAGVTGATAVAAGASHSLVLMTGGTLRATGYNLYGQLGDGTWTTPRTSVVTPSISDVSDIAAGSYSSYARKSDGTLWAWGAGGSGQLGDNGSASRISPYQIAALPAIGQFEGGESHAIAVTADGVVWTWGGNTAGQLGDGTTITRRLPVAISEANYAWKVGTPFFSVPDGTYYVEKTVTVTCATLDALIHYTLDGAVPTEADPVVASGGTITIDQTRTLRARAWKTGMPASEAASAAYVLAVAFLTFSPTPTTYTQPRTVTISTTSPGAAIHYTLDGSIPGGTSPVYTGPLSVATSTTIKAIGLRDNWTSSTVATGIYTMNFGTLAAPVLTPPGATYTSEAVVTMTAMDGATIRYTTNGTTPTTSSPAYSSPISVTATTTYTAKAFHPDYTASPTSAATYTILVATPSLSPTAGTYPAGQVITVTEGTAGATVTYTLNGATPTSADPVVPPGGIVVGNFTLKLIAWKAGCTASPVVTAAYQVSGSLVTPLVAGGYWHSLAVRTDATAWAWGANGNGQLGDGTTTPRALPVMAGGLTGAVHIAAGELHSLAVRSDGTLMAWGSNLYGRLGDGTTTQRVFPVFVQTITDGVAVAAGSYHSLALRGNGTVWAWGENSSGQLGTGNTQQQLTPVQAVGLTNITGITARGSSSLAVKSDGTLWSWGANGSGQLGLGDTTSRSTPIQIPTLTGVTAVGTGGSHTVALLSDGTLRAFGNNYYGQLGDGTIAPRTSPVAVSGLSGVTAVAAGSSHSLALRGDGTVWAWGYNGDGQVGDGTNTERHTPVPVQGLPAIAAIAAGTSHSLAIAGDGSVWAWGRNSERQLGDGTTISRNAPVQIAGPGMAWKVAAPVLSLASGAYFAAQTVTVTEADPDAVLHYTIDGSDPSEAAPIIASGGSIPIDVSRTVKVKAWKPGAVSSETVTGTYELRVLAPVLTPASGRYAAAQSVAVTTSTPGATFTYTTDGSEPSTSSTAYAGPIAVLDTRTLKARAYKAGWTSSDSAAASYWIDQPAVAMPTIAPGGGTFTSAPLVTLASATEGATIRYTLDGTDPDGRSSPYVYPFLVSQTTTVKARAFKAGYASSAIASAAYALDAANQAAPPSIVPGGGRFATAQRVTISGPAGATLRYTTSGVDPTDADALVPPDGVITVPASRIVKARAWVAGQEASVVRRADFFITGAVAAGHQHSLALKADGTVWSWGRGSEGEIGNGTIQPTQEAPTQTSIGAVAAIGAGHYHSLAVRDDGTVWAWGLNGSGRLGDNSTTSRNTPVQAIGLTDVVAVAGGADHSLALKRDGTVWAWGDNTSGQLGDGTTTARWTPVQVIGLAGVTSIGAGEGFSLAIQRDGAGGGFVWAWGRNDRGQLGDGSTLPRAVPVRVTGVSTARLVAAGQKFGVAALGDGTVRAWGDNTTAQLGDLSGGFSTDVLTVPALAGTAFTAGGLQHALALDGEGRAWGWGDDTYAQLGAPKYTDGVGVGAPQLVPGSSAVLTAAGGWQQTLVARADGTVWATGGFGSGLGPGGSDALAPIPDLVLVDNACLMDDPDLDGLATWEEYLAGTDPLDADSNGNGLSDLVDVRRRAQSANPDDDGDGVPNAVELSQGTDPFAADTDGDGVNDRLDAFPLDPARTQVPPPDPNDTTPPVITLTQPASARPAGGGGQ